MTDVLPRDVLLRIGGRTLHRTGYLAAMGAGRGYVEVKETFARADATTCATLIDRDSSMRTAAAGLVRIEYPPALSGLVDQFGYPYCGPLLEGSRINAFTFSEDFTNGVWVPVQASISPNTATAPDGTVTMDKLVEDATPSATHYVARTPPALTDNTNQPVSVFAKAAERSWIKLQFRNKANVFTGAYFDLVNGVLGIVDGGVVANIAKVSNGYRCSIMLSSSTGAAATEVRINVANANGGVSYSGDGVSGVYIWGAQFETDKIFPSSYIKAVGSAVTRAADSLTLPFNFGPMDITVLARMARPVHADAVGTTGVTAGIGGLGDAVAGDTRFWFNSGSRTISTGIRTTTTDVQAAQAIPAGTTLNVCSQYQNLRTAGQTQLDVGSGFGGFSGAGAAMASFANQILRVGAVNGGNELYGVLLDLIIARGLRSLAEMQSIP